MVGCAVSTAHLKAVASCVLVSVLAFATSTSLLVAVPGDRSAGHVTAAATPDRRQANAGSLGAAVGPPRGRLAQARPTSPPMIAMWGAIRRAGKCANRVNATACDRQCGETTNTASGVCQPEGSSGRARSARTRRTLCRAEVPSSAGHLMLAWPGSSGSGSCFTPRR